MSDVHKPPAELYLGITSGAGVVHAFDLGDLGLAMGWLRDDHGEGRRKLYLVKIAEPVEYRYVEPSPYIAPVRPPRTPHVWNATERCAGCGTHWDDLTAAQRRQPCQALAERKDDQ